MPLYLQKYFILLFYHFIPFSVPAELIYITFFSLYSLFLFKPSFSTFEQNCPTCILVFKIKKSSKKFKYYWNMFEII